jgi:putative nucleotidyltransferase with HDIG domain
MPFNPTEIQQRAQMVGSLPTLPGVVHKLIQIVEEDHVSGQEIARIIGSDQVVSARVLKIVNSAFYGFPGRITTVSHALVLLGFNVIKGLVLSASVIDFMSDGMVGLWEHSFATAVASGRLARKIGERDPEEASVAGLLHDLGKVILSVEMKDVFKEATEYRQENGVSLFQAERAVMGGISHADIGAWVAKEWNLPLRLREALAHHHAPSRAQFEPRLAMIAHVGNAIVRGINFGFGGDRLMPLIEEKTFGELGLTRESLIEVIDEVDMALEEVDCGDFVR